MNTHTGRRTTTAICAALTTVTLAGCSSSSGTTADSAPAESSSTIGAERCQQNRDAGPVIYLTSYDLGGGAGVLSQVAAEGMGFYEDLCLDVEVRPKTDNNSQMVSAGTAQFAGLGSASDVLAAQANGAQVMGIGTFGNVGQVALVTMADGPIQTLSDLEGAKLGYKVTMPGQLRSMLEANDVDFEQVEAVKVGFDPSILPQGQVEALQAYKDNEPGILEAAGHDITVWDPAEFGVEGTFSTTIVNTAWGESHPTAVEDFLRATYHAFNWLRESDENLAEGIAYAESVSQAGFDAEHETTRWHTSSDLVVDNLLDGHGVGYQSTELWQPEADELLEFGTISEPLDVASLQTARYVDAIYDGSELIWPAPGAE
mgnify:CR=1 FL=1|jgi:putative hydroxymethylpyrimidine transport system substrate-binding protein